MAVRQQIGAGGRLITHTWPAVREQEPRESGERIANEYAELKGLVKGAGLLEAQPAFYARKMIITLGMLAVSLAVLVTSHPLWLHLTNAAFLAFIFTQLGFLFHDIGHRAFARPARRNAFYGLVFGNVLTGVSRAWWSDGHNAHHSHPNQMDEDPNVDIPILAFTEEQARSRRGLARFIVSYQHLFLFPIFCLEGFNAIIQSFLFLHRADAPLARREVPLLVLHYVLYTGLVVLALGGWQAMLFILVHRSLVGLYASSVFAPNHKGMPTLEKDVVVGFLHQQVLTARNVRAHPVTDYWYGGLNYQIEHHLFPTMPRNKLRQAQGIVRAFCQNHGISYHETGVLESYGEILRHLRQVGMAARPS